MHHEVILDLLKSVYRYYPVGLPNFQSSFEGRAKAMDILEKKIIAVQDGTPNDWTRLISVLTEKKIGEVRDAAYIQFPSYTATIILKQASTEWIEFTQYLHVTVSLLTNYYTVYFEDRLGHKVFYESEKHNPHTYLYYSNIRDPTSPSAEAFHEVKSIVASVFRNHQFVPHQLLFDHKVQGVYSLYEPQDQGLMEAPLFTLLFDIPGDPLHTMVFK